MNPSVIATIQTLCFIAPVIVPFVICALACVLASVFTARFEAEPEAIKLPLISDEVKICRTLQARAARNGDLVSANRWRMQAYMVSQRLTMAFMGLAAFSAVHTAPHKHHAKHVRDYGSNPTITWSNCHGTGYVTQCRPHVSR